MHSKNVDRIAAEHFAKYEPVQFLAFWCTLWLEYERAVGKHAYNMEPKDHNLLTASELSKRLENEHWCINGSNIDRGEWKQGQSKRRDSSVTEDIDPIWSPPAKRTRSLQ